MAFSLFGIQLKEVGLSLSEKMKLVTLLIARAALSQTAVEAAVNKAKKKEVARTPGIP